MTDWKEYKLGELVDVAQGLAINSKTSHLLAPKGLPLLRITDLINNKFSQYIYEDKAPRQCIAYPDDIIYTRTGQVGLVFRGKHGVIHNNSFKVIPKGSIDQGFLFWFLSNPSIRELAINTASGSVQLDLTHAAFKNIPTLVPNTIKEQKAIASVFDSIEDKLDLLHRQNNTLELLAETLFRQWFVEEAKETWERKSLDHIANYLNGLALQKYPVNDGESLPVIKIRELNQGITNSTDKCSRTIPEQYIIQDGDILFSWSGSLQIVIWHDGEGALNQHLFKVTSDNYPKWFYYLATKHHLEGFRAIAESKSTTMGHIQRHHLTEAFVFIPPEELFNRYDNIISPLIEKLIKNNAQIKILIKQRDTLLPRLMSGEVRIKF